MLGRAARPLDRLSESGESNIGVTTVAPWLIVVHVYVPERIGTNDKGINALFNLALISFILAEVADHLLFPSLVVVGLGVGVSRLRRFAKT